MRRAGIENTPSELVTAFVMTPVSVCLAATSAPGMTAADASVTVPERVCEVAPCAYAWLASEQSARVRAAKSPIRYTLRIMECSILRAAHGPGRLSPRLPNGPSCPVLDSCCIRGTPRGIVTVFCGLGPPLHQSTDAQSREWEKLQRREGRRQEQCFG